MGHWAKSHYVGILLYQLWGVLASNGNAKSKSSVVGYATTTTEGDSYMSKRDWGKRLREGGGRGPKTALLFNLGQVPSFE
ncbi:hypothetical protein F4809DRAFT_635516 [Biscogniauxia mediterranea]|nr:hypothetical protein F4809DRAFT_635516 [Biscogniauxia mediterranea]